MRVLILAHGDGRRWVNKAGRPWLGEPKHFVRVDGESLVSRTVRLVLDHGSHEILLVAPDDRYEVAGARRVALVDPWPVPCDMSKLLATRHLWADDDRTVLLWGDVFYTPAAVAAIFSHGGDDYHVFRRPGRSETTGHRWDESFAVSFGPHEHERVTTAAYTVTEAVAQRRIKASHIRTHYAEMIGVPYVGNDNAATRRVRDTPHQTHVDDFTDDIDSPAEWLEFVARYTAHEHAEGRRRIVVLVPWIDTECSWRQAARRHTVDHWRSLGVPVFEGHDHTAGPWVNRAAARNDAARQATDAIPDWEVAFLADADTFVFGQQFWAACHLAREHDQLVLAFDQYRKLTRASTRELLLSGTRRPQHRFEARARRSATNWNAGLGFASGALAVSREGWETVGGYDERFLSWGAEDRCFWLACNTLLGDAPEHIPGHAWHWWHPRSADKDREMPQYAANIELGLQYKTAAGIEHQTGALPRLKRIAQADPDAMRAILREPGAPLARRRRRKAA